MVRKTGGEKDDKRGGVGCDSGYTVMFGAGMKGGEGWVYTKHYST